MIKLNKLVNGLGNIKGKIEQNNVKIIELKEENKQSKLNIKDVKQEILLILEKEGLNALKDNDLINNLYWDFGFSLKELGSTIGVHNKLLKIRPKTKTVRCDYCKFEYEYEKEFKHSYIKCPKCEEKRIRREEEWKRQDRQHELEQEKLREKIHGLHTMPYRDYLQTYEWKQKSRDAMRRAGFKCQLCGVSGKKLNTHHNTYKRRGFERNTDLMVLCQECHETYSIKK